MTTQRALSTPTAILISGALIAAAVFLGLRSRSPESPAGAPDRPLSPTSSPSPRAAGDPDRAPPPPPAPAAPSTEILAAQVTKALEAQREALIKRCWGASGSQQKAPSVKLFVNVSFNASGQQVIRGLREDRETPQPELRQCVSDALKPLEIPPPGASVFVEVPFTLP